MEEKDQTFQIIKETDTKRLIAYALGGYSDMDDLREALSRIPTVNFYFASGYDPFAKNVTPLHEAAISGDVNAIKMLLGCEADINAQNSLGIDALRWAICYLHTEAVSLLINAGSIVNRLDVTGMSILAMLYYPWLRQVQCIDKSCQHDRHKGAEYCIESGLDSKLPKIKKITELLLDAGLNIDLKGNSSCLKDEPVYSARELYNYLFSHFNWVEDKCL